MKDYIVGSRPWAQLQIQSAYEQFDIESDEFKLVLMWYLAFLAAEKLKTLSMVKVSDLVTFDPRYIFVVLPKFEQDVVSNFWEQLVDVNGRTIRDRWEDRGKPIYNWLNKIFKYELLDRQNEEREYERYHRPYIEDPEPYDDFKGWNDGISAGDVLRHSVSAIDQPSTAYYEPPEEKGEQAIEDVVHFEPQPSAWSRPYLQVLSDFAARSPLNAAIAEEMKSIGRANASKIARMLNEKSFDISHDVVYRRIREFKQAANEVKRHDRNWRDRRAGSTDIASYWSRAGQTKAAREAVIAATVPKLVRPEFDRSGPISLSEWKAWGHQIKRPPVRPGLAQNVIIEDLPEDTGPYYSWRPPRSENNE